MLKHHLIKTYGKTFLISSLDGSEWSALPLSKEPLVSTDSGMSKQMFIIYQILLH